MTFARLHRRAVLLQYNARLARMKRNLLVGLPPLSLSGLVPGRLTNRLALLTIPPRREQLQQVGNVNCAVSSDVCGTLAGNEGNECFVETVMDTNSDDSLTIVGDARGSFQLPLLMASVS